MKKIVFVSAISVISIFAASGLQAAGNGTINFIGAVNSQTCNVSVNGTATPAAASVTLPTVQAGVLGTAGNTAGQTSFTMELTGCAETNPTGGGTVKAYYEQGATVNTNGLLINQATGGANNVVLQLLDGTTNNTINVGSATQQTAGNGYVSITNGAAVLPYSVRYYSTGVATSGAVSSSVTYTLVYN